MDLELKLKSEDFQELSIEESQETEGGLATIAAGIVIVGAGYTATKWAVKTFG